MLLNKDVVVSEGGGNWNNDVWCCCCCDWACSCGGWGRGDRDVDCDLSDCGVTGCGGARVSLLVRVVCVFGIVVLFAVAAAVS